MDGEILRATVQGWPGCSDQIMIEEANTKIVLVPEMWRFCETDCGTKVPIISQRERRDQRGKPSWTKPSKEFEMEISHQRVPPPSLRSTSTR